MVVLLASIWGSVPLALPAHAGRRHTPAPMELPAATTALCPIQAVDAARLDVAVAKGELEVERALRAYDQTIATWVVCAQVLGATGWTAPPVSDPLARELLDTAAAPPGSRERIEGVMSLRTAFPEASALLALADISTLRDVLRAEPAMRLPLTAGRLGPWACPEYVRWHPRPDGTAAGLCTDQRSVEAMALDALTALSTLTDPIETCPSQHWLCAPTAAWARSVWQSVSEIELPRIDVAPVAVPRWGRGRPLDPRPGWSLAVETTGVQYRRREVVRLTPGGLRLAADAAPTSTRPPDLEGDPLVYVADGVTVGRLASTLQAATVPRPVFAAQDRDTGTLVELRLHWSPTQSPSLDAGPVLAVELEPVGLVADQVARDVDAKATGQKIWLRVHPDTRFADVVAVHGALIDRHPDIIVSVRDLDAPDPDTD